MKPIFQKKLQFGDIWPRNRQKIAQIEVFGHFLDFASLVFLDFAHNDRWAWCLVVFLQFTGPVNVFFFCLFHRFWKYFVHRLLLYKKNHSWKFCVFSGGCILSVLLEIIIMILSVKMFWWHFKFGNGWIVFFWQEESILILFWIKMLRFLTLDIIFYEAALIMQNWCSDFLFSLFIGLGKMSSTQALRILLFCLLK